MKISNNYPILEMIYLKRNGIFLVTQGHLTFLTKDNDDVIMRFHYETNPSLRHWLEVLTEFATTKTKLDQRLFVKHECYNYS